MDLIHATGEKFQVFLTQMHNSDFQLNGKFWVIETSATKAVSKVYQNIFQNKTQYSGSIVGEYEIFIYGLDSSTHSDWNKAGNGYKSSIIHTYKKRAAIFVSKIDDDKCYVYIYQDFKIQKTFLSLLRAVGCSDITSWFYDKSKVESHTIIESKRHAVLNGFDALPIEKLKFQHLKFKIDIHNIFTGSRFIYQDDLGGLYSECNKCEYEIFASINTIIAAHVDESLKEELIKKLNILKKYMRCEYIKDLKITSSGTSVHKSCIYHCLKYSFGICNLQHPEIYNNCEELFHFFDLIKTYVVDK
ncbi:hypothetical protein GLOIN_2v326913 [Rhizophagus clarus]|uniref:Uncharacterized protein n=1 Tax=Rhizophagus clarus TaxID=94130 RepID=A0A8H3QXY2_9GLOM|nr:hypothetical protein GLOIN_2v326913 [Rhizophagus clarus]